MNDCMPRFGSETQLRNRQPLHPSLGSQTNVQAWVCPRRTALRARPRTEMHRFCSCSEDTEVEVARQPSATAAVQRCDRWCGTPVACR